MGEKTSDGLRRFVTPLVDEISLRPRRRCVKRREDRSQLLLLGAKQRSRIAADALVEQELEQELGAHVTQMRDRLAEPSVDFAATRGRGSEDCATRPAAGFGSGRTDEAASGEKIHRAVRQWPRQGPDSADLAVPCQLANDGPAVAWLFCEQGEHSVLAE
jgi:hypothetical protein